MKVILVSILCFVFQKQLFSQSIEGKITYERKQHMHRTISEEMKAFVPEYRTSKHVLIFNEVSSIYKSVQEEEAPQPNSGGGMVMRFGGGSNDETFYHFTEKKKVISRDVFGEQFLILDSIKNEKWKLSNETKTIFGQVCRKATLITKSTNQGLRVMMAGSNRNSQQAPTEKDIEIIAWYAENLTSPTGPDIYNGLPGVILEMDIDSGAITFSAIDISAKADLKLLKEPKKGKKVTPEGFQKALNEIMQNIGPGGMRIGGM